MSAPSQRPTVAAEVLPELVSRYAEALEVLGDVAQTLDSVCATVAEGHTDRLMEHLPLFRQTVAVVLAAQRADLAALSDAFLTTAYAGPMH